MHKTKPIQKLIGLFAAGALLLSGCSALTSQASPTVEPPPVEEIIPIVSATGVVTPADWTVLSFSTSGIVEQVLVDEGDSAAAGQVLVRLKGKEDLQAAITAAQFEVSAAEKALDDLNDAAETAKIQALESISSFARMVRDAQYLLDNFTVPTDQQDLDPLEALDRTQKALDEARQEFEPYKTRPSSDQTRQDLKEALDQAQSDYNAAVRRLEYVNAVEAAQASLEQARQDYVVWSNGPDPDEVALAQARLDNSYSSLEAAQAKLQDLELVAPFGGTVSEIDVRLGQWVTVGLPVLQLADLDHLRVETTDLNEIDAARVHVGSQVIVTFDALPGVEVQGRVTSVAPKSSQGSGVNYRAVIELEEVPAALRWGMTAFVDIEVE